MAHIDYITERVCHLGDPDDAATPRPLLTVDEFFQGNTVVGSIGCNLGSAPAPDEFHSLFRAMAQRPEVKDIRIQITAFDDPEWPFSDTVYIMTSATPEQVMAWFPEHLRPDETWAGFADRPYEPYQLPSGVQAVACWWD